MESKTNRIINAFDNINEAIEDILKNRIVDNPLNKLSQKDKKEVIKKLNDIRRTIYSLILNNQYKTPKLDEIRSINLSILYLYDQGDYDLVFNEIMKTNNKLSEKQKSADRQKLGELKQLFNVIPPAVRKRLNTAQRTQTGKIAYFNNEVDNLGFITSKYLNVKYNFKKVKYDTIKLEDQNERNEVIVYTLNQIIRLCDEKEYSNIKNIALQMIKKYDLNEIDVMHK